MEKTKISVKIEVAEVLREALRLHEKHNSTGENP